MPSLIPNYIARLRTHSQSTAASSSSHSGSRSNSTAGPPTPGSELARLAADPTSVDNAPHVVISRKIHPDLSTLLDEDAPQETVAAVLGPHPPRERSSSPGQLARTKHEIVSQQEPEQKEASQPDAKPSDPDNPDVPTPSRSRLLSRILSTPLLSAASAPTSDREAESDSGGVGTHWSTFGRRRPFAATVSEFGSLHRRGSGSKGSANSKSSRRRQQRRSTPTTPSATRPPSARGSTPSRTQTITSANDTSPSQPHSPAGTVSSSSGSKSYSVQSHSFRSRRPQSYPDPIPDAESPSLSDPQTPHAHTAAPSPPFTPSPVISSPLATKPTLDDSPHTFGRPTPKRAGASSRPYPGLGNAFLPPPSSTPPSTERRQQNASREPPSTYPPRKNKRPVIGSSISFPSLPLKPVRSNSGPRPRAEDVFRTTRFVSDEGGEGSGRRISADWSAAEAVKGGDGDEEETWPATVSREMVRLSLAGGTGAVSVGEDPAEMGEVVGLRERGVKNPMLFGSTGEDRRRFFRATRRKTGPDSPAPAITVSSLPSSHASILSPAFSISPSGATSGLAPEATTGAREGGLAPHLSVTAATPSASPSGSRMGTISESTREQHPDLAASSKIQGKRKVADADDDALLDESGKPMLSALAGSRKSSNRASDGSHAPSSFRQNKRIRLSTPSHSPEHSSRSQSHPHSPHQSPPDSPHSRPASSLRTLPVNPRTFSQSSISLRAIVSPHPPSIDRRSGYHMRDPALPLPRRQSTQWAGGARRQEEGRTAFPLQGWAFVLGFLVFPVWWVAAVVPVSWGWGTRGRDVQDGKGVWTEESLALREEWEYEVAYTWRRRCRFMSLLGLLLYVPLIVLLAVLVPRT